MYQLPVCAEMLDVGVHKLYSFPAFFNHMFSPSICSVQKCAYFHNTACYSHLLYFFIKCVKKCVEIKCQLDATEVFIADLIACSTCFRHHYAHHQELKSIIQWLLPVVFRAVVFKLLVWCGAEGYVSGLQTIRSEIKTSVAFSWHFISTY
jgi:hypothetical protein